MVQVLWEFLVRPEAVPSFERAYGEGGPWVRLFSRFAGYRGTSLLRDRDNPLRYLTVDSWETLEHRAAMLAAGREEYGRLDRECSGLTESEVELGVFDVAPGGGLASWAY